MADYKLSSTADDDLDRLFVYGVITFGLEQAENYVAGLYDRFANLAQNPLLWPGVPEIRQGYRRSVYASHSIYYCISNDTVEIIRILGRESIDDAFEEKGDQDKD